MARLIAKIEDAAGSAGAASSQVSVPDRTPEARGIRHPERCPGRRQAGPPAPLRPSRRRGDRTDVDPMRLLVVEGRPTWRDGAGAPRASGSSGSTGCCRWTCSTCRPRYRRPRSRWTWSGLFTASPSDVLVELELGPAARWFAEDYPCETVTELGDGRLRIGLRTPDTGWLRRRVLRLGEDARVVSPASLATRSAPPPPRRSRITSRRLKYRAAVSGYVRLPAMHEGGDSCPMT